MYSFEQGNRDSYILTVANIINNTLNTAPCDTPSFACLGYDSCPHIYREELCDIYNYDSPESLVILVNTS